MPAPYGREHDDVMTRAEWLAHLRELSGADLQDMCDHWHVQTRHDAQDERERRACET